MYLGSFLILVKIGYCIIKITNATSTFFNTKQIQQNQYLYINLANNRVNIQEIGGFHKRSEQEVCPCLSNTNRSSKTNQL